MNWKILLLVGVILVALYFIASPYQNCMRDLNMPDLYKRTGTCLRLTAW